MPSKKITHQQILEKKNQLQILAKQYHVHELYYFEPEETMPLHFMADVHFLVIPDKNKMSNADLYEFKTALKSLFESRVFVNTEDNLKEMLQQNVLSEAEYDLALKKNLNIINVFNPELAEGSGLSRIELQYNSSFFGIPNIIRSVESSHSKEIKGELLESFDELISFELEDLLDIKDERAKNLLIDILFDSNHSVSEVVNYTTEIDPVFGPRFGILYCCLNPDKWDDPAIEPYKKVVIDSYVERASTADELSDVVVHTKKASFLKDYAKNLVASYFKEKLIGKPTLTEDEKEIKLVLLDKIRSIAAFDSESIIDDAGKFQKEWQGLSEESKSGFVKPNFPLQFSNKDNEAVGISKDSWRKISLTSSAWTSIYDLIKYTPTDRERKNQPKLLSIVQAILYKEGTGCRWKDIPQSMSTATTAYHYYNQWKKNKVLSKINEIVVSQEMRVAESASRFNVVGR